MSKVIAKVLEEQMADEVVEQIREDLDWDRDERLESLGQGFAYWELQWEKSTEYERMKLEEEQLGLVKEKLHGKKK